MIRIKGLKTGKNTWFSFAESKIDSGEILGPELLEISLLFYNVFF